MRLISTRGDGEADGHRTDRDRFRAAVLGGLAPDGGLYLPARLPRLTAEELDRLRDASFPETAELVGLRLLEPVLGRDVVLDCVRGALDFDVPVVPLGAPPGGDGRTSVLELFHGPTGSFKDIGARFLARLLSHLRDGGDERVVVLVATSGDTGGAVARAVHGLPGVDAVILYPEGRLSPIQLQHVTRPGPGALAGRGAEDRFAPAGEPGRVYPVPVRGSFDDCQRMVKEILAEGSPWPGTLVTSANSVNLGRLLPQAFFHVYGWARCARAEEELIVSVPSANLGNLTAGLIARGMGVPIDGFVAATNQNAALPRFLESGRPPAGDTVETLSSAMDVARPSNLERLLTLAGEDRRALAGEVMATSHGDEETIAAMREIHENCGYLADPHTAVGWLGLREARAARPGARGLLVATADPAKFPGTVLRATGHRPAPRADWAAEVAADVPTAGLEAASPIDPDSAALRELICLI